MAVPRMLNEQSRGAAAPQLYGAGWNSSLNSPQNGLFRGCRGRRGGRHDLAPADRQGQRLDLVGPAARAGHILEHRLIEHDVDRLALENLRLEVLDEPGLFEARPQPPRALAALRRHEADLNVLVGGGDFKLLLRGDLVEHEVLFERLARHRDLMLQQLVLPRADLL